MPPKKNANSSNANRPRRQNNPRRAKQARADRQRTKQIVLSRRANAGHEMTKRSLEMSIAFPYEHPQRFPMVYPQPTNFLINRQISEIVPNSYNQNPVLDGGSEGDALIALIGLPGLAYAQKVRPQGKCAAHELSFVNSAAFITGGANSAEGWNTSVSWDLLGPMASQSPNLTSPESDITYLTGAAHWPLARTATFSLPAAMEADPVGNTSPFGVIGVDAGKHYLWMDDEDTLLFRINITIDVWPDPAVESRLSLDLRLRVLRWTADGVIYDEPIFFNLINDMTFPAGTAKQTKTAEAAAAWSPSTFIGTASSGTITPGFPGWYGVECLSCTAFWRATNNATIAVTNPPPTITALTARIRHVSGIYVPDPEDASASPGGTTSANILKMFDFTAPYDKLGTGGWPTNSDRRLWKLFDSNMIHSTLGGDDVITEKVRINAASLMLSNTTSGLHRGGLVIGTRRVGFDPHIKFADLSIESVESFDAVDGAFTFIYPEDERQKFINAGGRNLAGRVDLRTLASINVHYIYLAPPAATQGPVTGASSTQPNSFRLQYDELLEFQPASKRYIRKPCMLPFSALQEAIARLEAKPEYFYRNHGHMSEIYNWIASTGRRARGAIRTAMPMAQAASAAFAPQYMPLLKAVQGLVL